MKILHVIRSANPAGGGPIEAVTRLGLEHERQGRTIEVATLDAPDSPWFAAFPLRYHALGPARLKYGYSRRLLPWLRAHAAEYDVVVANGLWQYSSFAVWRALSDGRQPYAVFPHGMLDPWFKRRYPLKHVKKWLYWPWAEYRVLRDAAAVCFTSDEEQVRARSSFWLYRCKELVVGYGTARSPGDGERQRDEFLARFPSATGARLILFLGRLHEKKGCDLLIKAFGSVLRSQAADGVTWRLILAGPVSDDAYDRRLSRLVDRHCPPGSVVRTGMLDRDLKWGAYHAADVFILPSHQENFGLAVAESLASRVPVLLSNRVNIWREVTAAGAGLADSDDEAGTRRLLQRWMSLDEVTHERMRDNAAACFEQFDAPRVAARIGAHFEALR